MDSKGVFKLLMSITENQKLARRDNAIKLNKSGLNSNKGIFNGNYRGGNRLTGNFPCPQCNNDRIAEKRYSDKICRKCYILNKKKTPEEMKEIRKGYAKNAEIKRKTFKNIIIDERGGCCEKCNKSFPEFVYHFHHLNPEEKETNPSSLFRQSDIGKIRKELRNCIMVCANCHMIIHWDNRESLSYS